LSIKGKSEKNTLKNCRLYLITFTDRLSNRNVEGITPDDILAFWAIKTEEKNNPSKKEKDGDSKTIYSGKF